MYNDDPRMVGPIVGQCAVLGPNGDNGPDGINGLYPHEFLLTSGVYNR